MKDLRKNISRLFKENIFPICVITLVVMIFFWKVLLKGLVPFPGDFIVGTYYPWLDYKWGFVTGVPVKNPILSDVASVIYPFRSLAVDVIKSGELPLWNKYSFAGYPLLAVFQNGILSPTFIFYFIFSKIHAWTFQIIFQHILAGSFFYIFLRHFRLKKISCIVGALVFDFSGFNLIWSEWNTHVLAAAWIPLVLFVTDKSLGSKKLLWGVLLSILTALHIFSGYPQIYFYTMLSIFLWIITTTQKKNWFRNFTFVGVFSLLGIVLTSVQSIPALELFLFSQRSSEILNKDLIFLPLQNLVTLFAPDYFGNHSTGNFWGVGNYTLNIGYSGLVAFILAVIGYLSFNKNKEIRYFSILILLSLALSLKNPLSFQLAKLPFIGGAASLTRILLLMDIAISALTAYGVESLLLKIKFSVIKAIIIPTIVLSGSLVVCAIMLLKFPEYVQKGYLFDVGLRNLILPFALLITSGILLYLYKYKNFKFSAYLIIFFAIIELFRFGWKFNSFTLPEYVFPTTPSIDYLKQLHDPSRMIAIDSLPANMWVPYGLASSAGYDNMYPNYWAKYIAVHNSAKVEATPQGRYATLERYEGNFLDIANTKYLLVHSDEENPNEQFLDESAYTKLFTDKSMSVWRNEKALPKAKMFYDWEVIDDDRKMLSKLLNSNFDTGNLLLLSHSQKLSSEELGEATTKVIEDGYNFITLETDTSEDGYLLLSNIYYPGWNAYVDGVKQDIERANYAFEAIPIIKGKHKVLFIYEPMSFKIGLYLTLIGLIITVSIGFYETYKTIRSRTS